jgi:tetratricopeptide (TPR) repeat protein
LIRRGEALERSGETEQALSLWRRAADASSDARVQARLGGMLLQRGLSDEAGRRFERAAALDPSPRTFEKLSDFHKSRGELDAAARWLAKALRRPGADASLIFKLGWVRGQAGEEREMRRAFRDYLGRKDASASAGVRRAAARACLLDYEGAASEADQRLGETPANDLTMLLRCWPENWRRPHAPAHFERHLDAVEAFAARRPGSPWPSFFRHALLLRLGRFEELAGRGGELRPFARAKYGWMRYAAGVGRLQAGRFRDAAADFGAACRSRPELWKAACYEGEARLCLGQPGAAFERFSRAERAAGRLGARAEVLAWRGEALLWLGRLGPAEDALHLAVCEGSWLAVCWRGAARLLAGKLAQAEGDLDRAVGPDSNDGEALVWRAELRRRRGRPGAALADLQKAARLGPPGWEGLVLNRALARAELGDAAGAGRDWRELSKDVAAFIEKRTGRGGRPGGRIRALAEKGLELAGGIRRPDRYLRALWLGRRAPKVEA